MMPVHDLRRLLLACLLSLSSVTVPVAGLKRCATCEGQGDLDGALARLGERVEDYYARARSIVCLETVRLQPLTSRLEPAGRARRLEYELRVSWEPPAGDGAPPEATVLRQLVTVDGRPPRPRDEPGCMDPKPVSPEPLAILLPARRREFAFSRAGSARLDGRDAVLIDYKGLDAEAADVAWRGSCVTVSLPGRTQGRLWADAATHDVLRLDERLIGHYELRLPRDQWRAGIPRSLVIERADSSIRYRAVTFRNPDETVTLPSSIETLTVIRNAAVPRLRTTQVFSQYMRFMADARIVR
jgi:hypothetical protein